MHEQEQPAPPVMKKYTVEYVNTALGPGHFHSTLVEAESKEEVPTEFYKWHRPFCEIKTITEK